VSDDAWDGWTDDEHVSSWVLTPHPGVVVYVSRDEYGAMIELVFDPAACAEVAALTGYGVLLLGRRAIGVTISCVEHPAVIFRVIDERRN
jgi:hypothetical protein